MKHCFLKFTVSERERRVICFSASPETSRNSNAVAAAELAKNLEDRPAGAEETESGCPKFIRVNRDIINLITKDNE